MTSDKEVAPVLIGDPDNFWSGMFVYVCSNFITDYFMKRDHNVATRNNGYHLELPKIRQEYSRGSFYYMGTKLDNDLPLQIYVKLMIDSFNHLLLDHF